MTQARQGRLATVLLVAGLVVLIDQAVKWFMVEFREGLPAIDVVGELLQIRVIRNPGAAFGIGGGLTVIFSAIAIVVAVVVVRQARTMTSTAWAVVLGGLLGGAIGNLIDRLLREPAFGRGAVVDWIDVQYFSVFNLADAALTLSAIGIIVLTIRGVPLREVDEGPGDALPEGDPRDPGAAPHGPYSAS